MAGSLLAGLLVAEIGLRLFNLAPTDGAFTVDADEFARLPGLFSPARVVTDRSIPALTHRITIDSLGFRASPVARRKPAGEARILFVGDSFTFGEYVNDHESLPARVEARLAQVCRGRVRTINAGVRGSTIADQIPMVDRALPLAPDVVVLVFSENDVQDLGREPLWDRLAAARRSKSRFPLSAVYPLLRRTALWHLGLRVSAVRAARAASPDDQPAGSPPASPPELRHRYQAHLLALRDRLAGQGIALVFVIFPSHDELTIDADTETNDGRWAAGVAGRMGLPTVDLLPTLRAAAQPATDLYLLPHDAHPSPRGHELAGTVVARSLQDQPVLMEFCR